MYGGNVFLIDRIVIADVVHICNVGNIARREFSSSIILDYFISKKLRDNSSL